MNDCDMQPLVEALHDGRLSERERVQVERHVTGCSDCAEDQRRLEAMAVALRGLGDRDLSPLEHMRGRLRLLREAAAVRDDGESRRRWRVPALVVAVATVAVAAFALFFAHGHGDLALARSSTAFVLGRTHFVAWVDGADGSSFDRVDDGETHVVELHEGLVAIRVRHLVPGERFLVRTLDAEVEVRGTRFTVESRAGVLAHVVVDEGVVEVRRGGEVTRLTAKETWPSSATASSEPGSASSGIAHGESSGSVSMRAAPEPSSGGATTHAPADGDFREGMGAVERGDFADAASKLGKFADRNGSDPRAEDALFLVAVALSKAGHATEAEEAAKRYLERYPHGYRRHDAERLAASGKLGR